jgi:hypothetical protein
VLHVIWTLLTYRKKLPVADVNATSGPTFAQVNVVGVGVPVTMFSSLKLALMKPSVVT